MPYAEAVEERDTRGAEVRFTFRTSGYRGEKLPVTWSLFHVDEDDVLDRVVAGQDRALAMTVQPDHCNDRGGYDLFIPIAQEDTRYRVILELFRDGKLDDRLDLVETDVFRG